MAIRGSLQEASLPDVIQLLYLGRRTGCLALADRGSHASVFLEDGWVTHATIVNRPDRLGDLLVKAGHLRPDHLEQAIALQARSRGRRLGEVLVELGLVAPAVLEEYVRRQVEEAVFALFSWRSGTFSFEPGVHPEGEPRVRIAPDALLLEGARRVDEWSVIEQKIPSFDLIFTVDRSGAATAEPDFSAIQHRLLPLLDGVRDVRAVVDESGLTEFEVCQALYGLIAAGLLHRVGTSTPATSARSREAQIEEHRNLGVAFFRSGMLDEALREFRRVMELRPAEGGAPFHLGLIAAHQGRWADAAYFFRRAADRAGPRVAALHNLAVALAQAGEPAEADELLRDACGRAPERAEPQIAWALLALDREQPGPAVARLERARELAGEPPPSLWYWAMGRALTHLGDLDRALAVSAEGVARWPDRVGLLNNHAVLLEAAGDLGEAEAVLNRALELDASVPQISKNLGDIQYRLGRFDEAWTAYERAARLAPDLGDDLHFKLGNLALRRGDGSTARRHWERAVALNPGHQLARANLETAGATDDARG
jgi:tetratricopeptide (TPR) repeat protein